MLMPIPDRGPQDFQIMSRSSFGSTLAKSSAVCRRYIRQASLAPPITEQPDAIAIVIRRGLVLQMLLPIDQQNVGDERVRAERWLVLLSKV